MRTRRLGPLHASWDRRSPAPEKNHSGPCFPVSVPMSAWVRPPPRPCFQQLVCISRPISSQLARDRVSRNRAISIHKSISNHLASFLHHQLGLHSFAKVTEPPTSLSTPSATPQLIIRNRSNGFSIVRLLDGPEQCLHPPTSSLTSVSHLRSPS